MIYKIRWCNDHACGNLSGTYTSRRAAEAAAREWKRGMVANDQKPAEARREYQWEVVEVPLWRLHDA